MINDNEMKIDFEGVSSHRSILSKQGGTAYKSRHWLNPGTDRLKPLNTKGLINYVYFIQK